MLGRRGGGAASLRASARSLRASASSPSVHLPTARLVAHVAIQMAVDADWTDVTEWPDAEVLLKTQQRTKVEVAALAAAVTAEASK